VLKALLNPYQPSNQSACQTVESTATVVISWMDAVLIYFIRIFSYSLVIVQL